MCVCILPRWMLALDPTDPATIRMHKAGLKVAGPITVPGAWQNQGFGEETATMKHQWMGGESLDWVFVLAYRHQLLALSRPFFFPFFFLSFFLLLFPVSLSWVSSLLVSLMLSTSWDVRDVPASTPILSERYRWNTAIYLAPC